MVVATKVAAVVKVATVVVCVCVCVHVFVCAHVCVCVVCVGGRVGGWVGVGWGGVGGQGGRGRGGTGCTTAGACSRRQQGSMDSAATSAPMVCQVKYLVHSVVTTWHQGLEAQLEMAAFDGLAAASGSLPRNGPRSPSRRVNRRCRGAMIFAPGQDAGEQERERECAMSSPRLPHLDP